MSAGFLLTTLGSFWGLRKVNFAQAERLHADLLESRILSE